MSVNPEYSITKFEFNSSAIDKLYSYSFAQDLWPVIYFLREGEGDTPCAYVGETMDIVSRLSRHLTHPYKSKLRDLYLISGDKFNKSATLDIEASLIRYLSGDGIYKLLNANLGLSNHSYYQKDELYREVFKSIWSELISKKVVSQTLDDIDNSDLYKYSPYKALSIEQMKSLILMLEMLLDHSKRRFIIQGGAGSGKTVLAVFLFKLLHTSEDDYDFNAFGSEDHRIFELVRQIKTKCGSLKMAIVIPMDSFRATVKQIFRHVKGLKADMVIGPAELSNSRYDILFVDEAHRLRRRVNLGTYFGRFDEVCEELQLDRNTATELDWVMQQSDKSLFFYDEYQSIKPSDVRKDRFIQLKDQKDARTEYLYSQFRVRGGWKYVKFIDELLSCNLLGRTEKITFQKYEFCLFDDLEQMIDHIKQKERQGKLARVVAGYAWPWPSKKDKTAFDIKIGSVQLQWNSKKRNWINSENAINEVGCIHTVQGYDLNYTGIIFGNEIGYDKEKNEIIIRKENYFDLNGRNGIENIEQLKGYILNIYKTIMLRGIRGTYLYVCDDALREYFANYIPLFSTSAMHEPHGEKQLIPFVNCVPLYDLKAAAGGFSDLQQVSDHRDWYKVIEGGRISKEHFACQVVGESMNKVIPNGAICLFRKYSGGSRNGEIVLVSHTNIQDADFGSNYTVKEYFSEKSHEAEDGTWEHTRIVLKPLSNDSSFENIELDGSQLSEFKVHGIFERILKNTDI